MGMFAGQEGRDAAQAFAAGYLRRRLLQFERQVFG